MNALVPLIDIYAKPRIFGTTRGGNKWKNIWKQD
jgi:electron transport complex protein RnfD